MAASDLSKFLQLAIEEKEISPEDFVQCTSNLLSRVPTARPAVLSLLSSLFDEHVCYFTKLASVRTANKAASTPGKDEEEGKNRHPHHHLPLPKPGKLMSLIRVTSVTGVSNETAARISKEPTDGKRVSVESLGSVKDAEMEETPASPTPADEPCDSKSALESMEVDDEDVSESSSSSVTASKPEDILISRIHDSIMYIMTNESSKPALVQLLVNWAICQISCLSANCGILLEKLVPSPLSECEDDLARLKELMDFWLKSPVMQLLLKIIQTAIESSYICLSDALLRLIEYKCTLPNVPARPEWICCYLLTSFGSLEQISQCIHLLLSTPSVSPSVTESIFAFLSANNPQAIINCSKSNVTFLLRLCSRSKPLLDVFTADVSLNTVKIDILNQYVSTLSLNDLDGKHPNQDPNLKRYLIDGLLSADNSFELLMLAIDLTFHPESSDHLKSQLFAFLQLVLDEVRLFAYSHRGNHRMIEFLNQLKAHHAKLMRHKSFSQSPKLKKFQLQFIQLLSVYFGFEFTIELLHEAFACEPILTSMLNQPSARSFSSDSMQPKTELIATLKPNPILGHLLQSLQLHLGSRMKDVLDELLKISSKDKNQLFWLNFASFAISYHHLPFVREGFNVSLSLLTEQFIDLMHLDVFEMQLKDADMLEVLKDISNAPKFPSNPLLAVLVIIHRVVERSPKLISRQNHSLCVALVINYMNMVEKLELLGEKATCYQIATTMSILVMSQKIMALLVNEPVACAIENQEVLTRTFMECIIEWNEDLEQAKRLKEKPVTEVSLLHENINYGGQQVSFKFRKIPLNPNKDFAGWKNQSSREPLLRRSLSRQLILDGLRVCIKSMDNFSLLLVEAVTPDVLFNDSPWPDEEFNKVTIERDLLISKMYDSHAILWDLTEMIAISGQLKNCAVLVRAIMAVQLTAWASGTMLEEKPLASTQKLVSILSKSSLIPEVPFKYVPEVIPSLDAWDTYSVLSEIWRLLKDTNGKTEVLNKFSSEPALLRPYLERLRVIMSHKAPSTMFVKIFKDIM